MLNLNIKHSWKKKKKTQKTKQTKKAKVSKALLGLAFPIKFHNICLLRNNALIQEKQLQS